MKSAENGTKAESRVDRATSAKLDGTSVPVKRNHEKVAEEKTVSDKNELPDFSKGEKITIFSNYKKEWLEGVVKEVTPPDTFFPHGAFKVTSSAGTKWVGAETARAVMKKKLPPVPGSPTRKRVRNALNADGA